MTDHQDGFTNGYADSQRADAYAGLDFPGTYFLAFRDLPRIIGACREGGTAIDFGCGAGRSTRFLRALGFRVVGIDIAEPMLERARAADPLGDYRLASNGDVGELPPGDADLVLCAFTFDNIPGWGRKEALFRGLRRALRPNGRIVNLVSSAALYVNEWASFSTRDFPLNAVAKTGDVVRTVILDIGDRRPVDDIFWSEDDYREVYRRAGLQVLDIHRPLGRPSDGIAWVNEARVSPWVIWVLRPAPEADI